MRGSPDAFCIGASTPAGISAVPLCVLGFTLLVALAGGRDATVGLFGLFVGPS